MSNKALSGLKVLELGQLIAGPFASKLLAEFGADVIKIEPPTKGDPLRTWRVIEDETSLWWYVQSRNKKSITLDLKKEEGQKVLRALVKEIDILIENFRPGTLEKWGIGYEELKKLIHDWLWYECLVMDKMDPTKINLGLDQLEKQWVDFAL